MEFCMYGLEQIQKQITEIKKQFHRIKIIYGNFAQKHKKTNEQAF